MFRCHKDKTITQGRLSRLLVLLWLVVCQFPMPMAHAHGQDATGSRASEFRLSKHLQKFHAEDSIKPDDVHWHFVILWKLACGCGEEADAIASEAASGCSVADWSPESLPSELVTPELVIWDVRAIASPSPMQGEHADNPPPGGFLQTYSAVTLTQLTCVFLC